MTLKAWMPILFYIFTLTAKGLWGLESSKEPYNCNGKESPRKCIDVFNENDQNAPMIFNGSCYEVIECPMTFREAVNHCKTINDGHLLSINSKEEQERIEAFLSQRPGNYLVGLHFDKKVSKWSWLDDGFLANNYSHWIFNDESDQGFCAQLISKDRASFGLWKTVDCNQKMKFICEVPHNVQSISKTITTSSSVECPKGYKYKHQGHCYKLSYFLANYDLALEHCQSEGAYLVSIGDEEEEKIISDVCSQMCLIGLREYSDGYKWTDPKTSYDASSYKNWYNDQPDSGYGNLQCVYIYNIYNRWIKQNCNAEKQFICEWDPDVQPTPPPTQTQCHEGKEDGWYIYPNISTEICYKFGKDKKTWNDAESDCLKDKGTLVSIHNWATVLELSKRSNFQPTWIGLISIDDKMEFKWTDGSSMDFSLWNKVSNPLERCAQMTGTDGFWNAKHCTEVTNQYFCQKPKSQTPQPPTTTPPPPLGHCKAGEEFLGHCYIYKDELVIWEIANKRCKDTGGQLASIHGEKEMAFLISRIPNMYQYNMWIGANDKSNNEVWSWSDKSPFNYDNWMIDRPEAMFHQYDCIALLGNHQDYIGRWSNEDCEAEFPFICKYDADPDAPLIPPKKCDEKDGTFTYLNDDGCYRYFETPETWKEAQKVCANKYSNLVTISDILTQSSIHAFLPEGKFWIGLSNIKNKDKFEWVDSSSYEYSNFANYKDHPPKTKDSCLYIDSQTGRWNVRNCDKKLPFICKLSDERSETTTPNPITTTPSSWEHCPNDKWRAGPKDRCFYVNNEDLDPWNADFHCNEIGGDFAGIHSSHENDFLTAWLKNDKEYWIGLLKTNMGQYIWADGEIYNKGYTNWKDDKFLNNVYISGKNGKWSSVDAYVGAPVVKPSICSVLKRQDPVITTTETPDPHDNNSPMPLWIIVPVLLSIGFITTIVIATLIAKKRIRFPLQQRSVPNMSYSVGLNQVS